MGRKIRVTLDEIMCSVAAKEIKDGERVFVGQGYPILAAMLAKKRHAPNSLLIMEGGVIDFEPYRPPLHIADCTALNGVSCTCDMMDTFSCYLFRGDIDVGFLGAAQVDKYGNINSSYIGDVENPEMRVTGSGGANEIGGYSKRGIILLRHGKFVEKLDYLTTPGYLEGYDSRKKVGLPGGPSIVVSSIGVFRFDGKSKEMYLESYHPGVTVEDIKSKVPWDLRISPNVQRTPLPSDEELALMRSIAPEISLGRAFALQRRTTNLLNFMQAKQM